jgi:phosphoribosylformimino-5-aminoimidazole carboxamide ribotide isomerase
MIVLPAIDLRGGKPVRLYQGDFNKQETVAEDAIEVAKSFEEAGSKYIHIVDLDGALEGSLVNRDIILEICRTLKTPIEVGGGIRTMENIEDLINRGVSRVILGSIALRKPEFVREAVKEFKDKIAVGIDAKNEYVSTEGWLNTSNVHYIDLALKMEEMGVDNVIFTDISRDGTLAGPNVEQLQKLNDKVSMKITASGGIKNLEDIKLLSKMNIYGAITGKAIYSGNLDLKQALKI